MIENTVNNTEDNFAYKSRILYILAEVIETIKVYNFKKFAELDKFIESISLCSFEENNFKGYIRYFYNSFIENTFEDRTCEILLRLIELCNYLGIDVEDTPKHKYYENNIYENLFNLTKELFLIPHAIPLIKPELARIINELMNFCKNNKISIEDFIEIKLNMSYIENNNFEDYNKNLFLQWIQESKKLQKTTTMRKGQIWMIALEKIDSNLYKEWTTKSWDCFFDDSNCDSFLIKILQRSIKDYNFCTKIIDM